MTVAAVVTTLEVKTPVVLAKHLCIFSVLSGYCQTAHNVCRAYCFPCIAPKQDLETVVQGTSLSSTAFQQALHAALRTLIDDLGMTTFNVGIMGMNAIGADQKADFGNVESSTNTSGAHSSTTGVEAR